MESIKRNENAHLLEITDKDGQSVTISGHTLSEFVRQEIPLSPTQESVIATAAQCCHLIRANGLVGDNDPQLIAILQSLLRIY